MSESIGKPPEMIEKTFEEFDQLNRADLAERLEDLILREHEREEGAFVLSLDGRFGSGKTTFLDMWETQLKAANYQVVRINAWETDFAKEPIVPVMSALMDFLYQQESLEPAGEEFLKVGEKLLGVVSLGASQFIRRSTGIDAAEIVASLDDMDGIEEVGRKALEAYHRERDIYHDIREKLGAYVASLEPGPLIIMVDEIDRARPDYAVEFLEAIKHLFSVQGVVFVLAVDKQQLSSAVQVLYGPKIDFNGYFRRFVSYEAELPKINVKNRHLNRHLNRTLDRLVHSLAKQACEERKLAIDDAHYEDWVETLCELFGMYDFTARDIKFMFRRYVKFLESNGQTAGSGAALDVSSFLMVLAMKDPDTYERVGSGEMTLDDMLKYFAGKGDVALQVTRFICSIVILSMVDSEKNQELEEFLAANEGNPLLIPGIFNDNSRYQIFGSGRIGAPIKDLYQRMKSWQKLLSP